MAQQSIRPTDYGIYGGSNNAGQAPLTATSVELIVFQDALNQPSTPFGGNFVFATGSFSPPSGWLATPPANPNYNVWVSTAIYNSNQPSIVWTTPGRVATSSGGGGSGTVTQVLGTAGDIISTPATPNSANYTIDLADVTRTNITGTTSTMAVTNIVSDGKGRITQVVTSPILGNQGTVTQVTGTTTDIIVSPTTPNNTNYNVALAGINRNDTTGASTTSAITAVNTDGKGRVLGVTVSPIASGTGTVSNVSVIPPLASALQFQLQTTTPQLIPVNNTDPTNQFLRGDGTWSIPRGQGTIVEVDGVGFAGGTVNFVDSATLTATDAGSLFTVGTGSTITNTPYLYSVENSKQFKRINFTSGATTTVDASGTLGVSITGGGGQAQSIFFIGSATGGAGQTFSNANLGNFSSADRMTVTVNGAVLTPPNNYTLSGTVLTIVDYLAPDANISVQAAVGSGGGGGGSGTVTSVNSNVSGLTFGANPSTLPVLAIQNASDPTNKFLRGDGAWQNASIFLDTGYPTFTFLCVTNGGVASGATTFNILFGTPPAVNDYIQFTTKQDPFAQFYQVTNVTGSVVTFTPALLASDVFTTDSNVYKVSASAVTKTPITELGFGSKTAVTTVGSRGVITPTIGNLYDYTRLATTYTNTNITITARTLFGNDITVSGTSPLFVKGAWITVSNAPASVALQIKSVNGNVITTLTGPPPSAFAVGSTLYIQAPVAGTTFNDVSDTFVAYNKLTGAYTDKFINLSLPYGKTNNPPDGYPVVGRLDLLGRFTYGQVIDTTSTLSNIPTQTLISDAPVASNFIGTTVFLYGKNFASTGVYNTYDYATKVLDLPNPFAGGSNLIPLLSNVFVIGNHVDLTNTVNGASTTATYYRSSDNFKTFTSGTLSFTNASGVDAPLTFLIIQSNTTFIAVGYFRNTSGNTIVSFYTSTDGSTWTAQANKTLTGVVSLIYSNPYGRTFFLTSSGYYTTSNYTDFDTTINPNPGGSVIGLGKDFMGITGGRACFLPDDGKAYISTDATLQSWTAVTLPENARRIYASGNNFSTVGFVIQTGLVGSVYQIALSTLAITNLSSYAWTVNYATNTARFYGSIGIGRVYSNTLGRYVGQVISIQTKVPTLYITSQADKDFGMNTYTSSSIQYLGSVDDYTGTAYWIINPIYGTN